MYKIFILTGEASGDKLGADLMRKLSNEAECKFYGVGGANMLEQGLEPIFPIEDINVMGFLEIIPHIPRLLSRINLCAAKIREFKPDLVITIDSPDFCFRVVKKIRQNFKTIHYVAPTVWAYRPKRAEYIAKLYDLLLVLFPFEPPYFQKYIKTLFVGHPIADRKKGDSALFLKKHDITTKPVIALSFGSRWGEVKMLGPIFLQAAKLFAEIYKDTIIVIPTFERFKPYITELISGTKSRIIIVTNETEKYDALAASDIAICKSGTISLDVALNETAMIVAHKVNPISAMIFRMVYLQKYISLLNISANKEIIPELLQEKCDPRIISECALNLYQNESLMKRQIESTKNELAKFLSTNKKLITEEILALCREKSKL